MIAASADFAIPARVDSRWACGWELGGRNSNRVRLRRERLPMQLRAPSFAGGASLRGTVLP